MTLAELYRMVDAKKRRVGRRFEMRAHLATIVNAPVICMVDAGRSSVYYTHYAEPRAHQRIGG